MNHHQQPTQDQIMLMSQLFPACEYTQIVSPQGEKKPRRKRSRKNKGGESGNEMNKKRKLSEKQVNILEENFGNEHKLDSERKDKLAMELGLDPRQVAVWFQNRRARWKNRKIEEEYSNLKKFNESTMLEKCLIETEVLKLREKLSEAEKEIQRLREPIQRITSSSSSTSSQSVEVVDPPFLGEFGVDNGYDDDDVFFMPNETCYFNGMEWINLYI